MKTKIEKKSFNPVDITLTFETKKELAAFYAVFIHTEIRNVLMPDLNVSKIYEAMDQDCGDIYNKEVFDRLCKIIKSSY